MLELLSETRRAAAECAASSGWAVPDQDLVACLVHAWAGVQQLTAAVAHLVSQAQVRGMPNRQAATSTVVWLRQQLRVSPATAMRLVTLAEALRARPVLDAAVSEGTVSAEQATTIAAAVAELPRDIGGETIGEAESMLVDWAEDFDPVTLGRLGARILQHVDPEAAERREAGLVARQEARDYRKRAFTMSPAGAGLVRLTGWLDSVGAATVNAALDPLCHPRHDAAGPRTPAQRRADALVDVCAGAVRGGVGLPGQGGDPAQMVVTVPLAVLTDQLGTTDPPTTTSGSGAPGRSKVMSGSGAPGRSKAMSGSGVTSRSKVMSGSGAPGRSKAMSGSGATGRSRVIGRRRAGEAPASSGRSTSLASPGVDGQAGVGWLDTGVPISAAEARRIACDAQILPAVLNGDSQVLDLGRARRLFTGPIRRALILRDRGCTFPGCDRPARWSEGHHLRAWADGGTTTLTNACLICRHHHRLLHNASGWQVHLAADGHPEYRPPAAIDPQRLPRRNTYHHRQ